MIRTKFENQLHELNNDLILMGALCEDLISKSVEALTSDDIQSTEEVSNAYQKIEQLERDIESQCLKLLLRQQPVARDLRHISAALKMVYDMKRIGAQSAEVAEIISLGHMQTGPELKDLEVMVKNVVTMVTDSIDSFVHEDQDLALKVIARDDTIDQEFDTIKKSLMSYFTGTDVDGEYAIDVLMVAKYIERIGDHTVNIAKWVIYSITGQLDGEGT